MYHKTSVAEYTFIKNRYEFLLFSNPTARAETPPYDVGGKNVSNSYNFVDYEGRT